MQAMPRTAVLPNPLVTSSPVSPTSPSPRRSAAVRLVMCGLLTGAALLASDLSVAAPLNASTTATSGATSSTVAHAPRVVIKTSDGDITVELYPEKAPKTVANFIEYVQSKQYNGTIFHRVIPGFMIQGGGFDPSFKQKATRGPIALEAQNGLSNLTGTLAMARTSDPDSATAQFFINTHDNKNLDYPSPDGNGYAVFGRVTSGMEVVKKIEATPTGSRGMMADAPLTAIVIESTTLLKP